MIPDGLPQLQVLLPYNQLISLLKASERVDQLVKDYDRLSAQQAALRGQFVELLDKYNELRDFVKD